MNQNKKTKEKDKIEFEGLVIKHGKKKVKLYPEDWEGDEETVSEEIAKFVELFNEDNSEWTRIETTGQLPKLRRIPSYSPRPYDKIKITIEKVKQ